MPDTKPIAVYNCDPMPNLSADIFWTEEGWTASISEHPPQGGSGVEIWVKTGIRSGWNAGTAMEAEWKRRMATESIN